MLMILALQFGKTQLLITNKIFDYLESKYNVSFHVKDIKISPFGEFKIHNILINDHHQDTLIYAQDIKGLLFDYQGIKNKKISFKNVEASTVWLRDKTYQKEEVSSLSVFSNKFKTQKKTKKPLVLFFEGIKANNLRYFKIKNNKFIVDFHQIKGSVKTLNIKGTEVTVATDSLCFKDVYGINYKKLKTNFNYTQSEMSFEDTHIQTDNSNLNLNLIFNYNNHEDFVDFVNRVQLKAKLENSIIALKDINRIYPHFKVDKKLHVDSELSGTLNALTLIQTKIKAEDNSANLNGNFTIDNSINNRGLFCLNGVNSKLKLNLEALTTFVPDQYHKSLPSNFYGVKKVSYHGDIDVSRSQMELDGVFKNSLGKLQLKGSLEGLNEKSKLFKIQINKGSLNKIKQFKDFRNVVFNGKVHGELGGSKRYLNTDLNFKRIGYKRIDLSNSNLKLELLNKDIKASFKAKDSLLSFGLDVNYQNKKEGVKEYELDFDIAKAKLSKLFPKSASYQKNVTGTGKLILSENKDSLQAVGTIHNFHIHTPSDSLNLNDVDLKFLSKGKQKNIKIKSKKLLDLKIKGAFEFSDFEKLVENALYKFIPGAKIRKEIKDQTLSFGLEVYPEFLKSITNKVTLHKNVKVSGILDAQGDKGVIYGNIPSFSSKDFKVDSLRVVLDNSNKWLNSNISASRVKFKKQIYDDLSLLGKKINDTLFVRSNFNTDKIDNRAVFHLTTRGDAFSMGIEKVYFKYLNSIWKNKEESPNNIYYNYKTGDWYFNGITFSNKNQRFDFDGSLKKNKSKNLRLALKNINLGEVLPDIDSLKIGGIASGEVFFKENNTLLRPDGNLNIRDLKINGVDYGLMETSIQPNEKKLGYDLTFNISNNNTRNVEATGEFLVNEKNFLKSNVDLDVFLNSLKLKSLSPLGRNVLSAIKGKAKGRFKVSGKLNDFNSYGLLELEGAGLKFPYLNVDYNFAGNAKIALQGKTFLFNNIQLEDNKFKTKGILQGKIDYDKYNNWNLDLRIDTDNLLVMNTKEQNDSRYYGTGFMDGFATIIGPTSDLSIHVTGKTLENTKFVLPISDVKQAESNRFIYFKKTEVNEVSEKDKVEKNLGGVSVLLNLDITKEALGEVVIDQTSGSSLQGRVDGRLLIDIDRYFNIKMYGDLIVDEGLYNFKYGGIVNKPFVVKKGGVVSWNGDPYKAELNIEALHSVKANPKVLLENLSVNRKIDVDLVTRVTGELFDSSQEFMIEIPNASSNVASELDFKLNLDENSKMRQFFSLLVSKTFFDENGTNTTTAAISNTTSELISNAVTDIFNNDEGKIQVNFGYTAGETSEVEDLSIDNQIDIGVATEINERILINGKLGVPVGTSTQSAVVGEVKIEFLLNKDGTLRSSVFNRQNEIQYSEEEQGYTQGLGLNYQIDFDNLTEMLQKLKLKKSKKKKEKEIVKDKFTEPSQK